MLNKDQHIMRHYRPNLNSLTLLKISALCVLQWLKMSVHLSHNFPCSCVKRQTLCMFVLLK